jgi:hypothetical protein
MNADEVIVIDAMMTIVVPVVADQRGILARERSARMTQKSRKQRATCCGSMGAAGHHMASDAFGQSPPSCSHPANSPLKFGSFRRWARVALAAGDFQA